MSSYIVTDPHDPRLTHGIDSTPRAQSTVYLVLSEEERAKGFVRPLRRAYVHVGRKPTYPLRPLTKGQQAAMGKAYVAYEAYPEERRPALGRYWTQEELDAGCGALTTMGLALCETYARDPKFYGATYCCGCNKHRPVAEFVWKEDGQVVGS